MEYFTTLLQHPDARLVLLFMALLLFAKNILPPLPSDALTVFAGTLITQGTVGFLPMVAACTLGSVAGFMVMFFWGRRIHPRLLEKERVLFIPVAYIQALKRLFERYGYYVIVANRFLGVKRIGVSFFAGLSGCSAWKTVLCAALSAAMWSGLLLYAGLLLGASWKGVLQYVSLYGWIMFAVLVSVLIVIVIKNRRSEISSASAGAIAE